MNYEGFFTWLTMEKHMGERSARDTVSRLRRVLRIVDENAVCDATMQKLNKTNEFATCSVFVKSQLKRSVRLYQEFEN